MGMGRLWLKWVGHLWLKWVGHLWLKWVGHLWLKWVGHLWLKWGICDLNGLGIYSLCGWGSYCFRRCSKMPPGVKTASISTCFGGTGGIDSCCIVSPISTKHSTNHQLWPSKNQGCQHQRVEFVYDNQGSIDHNKHISPWTHWVMYAKEYFTSFDIL